MNFEFSLFFKRCRGARRISLRCRRIRRHHNFKLCRSLRPNNKHLVDASRFREHRAQLCRHRSRRPSFLKIIWFDCVVSLNNMQPFLSFLFSISFFNWVFVAKNVPNCLTIQKMKINKLNWIKLKLRNFVRLK